LLLGLIDDLIHEDDNGGCLAALVLQRLGLRLNTVKAEVERALVRFLKTPTSGTVSFTPQAKRVLELAILEARELGEEFAGTEHLLLGLMKEGGSIAAQILESHGARLDEVRHETLALLTTRATESPVEIQAPEREPFRTDFTSSQQSLGDPSLRHWLLFISVVLVLLALAALLVMGSG